MPTCTAGNKSPPQRYRFKPPWMDPGWTQHWSISTISTWAASTDSLLSVNAVFCFSLFLTALTKQAADNNPPTLHVQFSSLPLTKKHISLQNHWRLNPPVSHISVTKPSHALHGSLYQTLGKGNIHFSNWANVAEDIETSIGSLASVLS